MTRKQAQLLAFIVEYVEANNGVSPSYDEMKDHLDLRSKSGVCRMLDALEQQGKIGRRQGQARNVYLVEHGLSIAPTIDKMLDSYCRTTQAIPRVVVIDALTEYFAKRKFSA